MGAPIGNSNAMTRGFRGSKLPPGCGHVANEVRAFRAEVLAELQADHGDAVPLVCLALLQSAARHEALCQLALKALRKLPDTAPYSDRLGLMDRIGRETDARDKCLKSMGLAPAEGKDKRSTFPAAFAAAFPPPPPEETNG